MCMKKSIENCLANNSSLNRTLFMENQMVYKYICLLCFIKNSVVFFFSFFLFFILHSLVMIHFNDTFRLLLTNKHTKKKKLSPLSLCYFAFILSFLLPTKNVIKLLQRLERDKLQKIQAIIQTQSTQTSKQTHTKHQTNRQNENHRDSTSKMEKKYNLIFI